VSWRERRLSAEEAALWDQVTRQIKPLTARPYAPPVKPPPRRAAPGPAAPAPPLPPAPPAPLAQDLTRLDGGLARRLSRGRYPIDGRLDLHGLTQAQAHAALDRCLSGAAAAGKRCILVITGKGLAGGGVLRRMLPRWLAQGENRLRVIAVHPAHVRHGGEGAYYVLLRRPRRHA